MGASLKRIREDEERDPLSHQMKTNLEPFRLYLDLLVDSTYILVSIEHDNEIIINEP